MHKTLGLIFICLAMAACVTTEVISDNHCEADADCPDGFACNPRGVCFADCFAYEPQLRTQMCAPGLVCDPYDYSCCDPQDPGCLTEIASSLPEAVPQLSDEPETEIEPESESVQSSEPPIEEDSTADPEPELDPREKTNINVPPQGQCFRDSDCSDLSVCQDSYCQPVECIEDFHCGGCKRCDFNRCYDCGNEMHGCYC